VQENKPGTALLSHLYTADIEDTWLGPHPKFKGFPYTKGEPVDLSETAILLDVDRRRI
jgi:hypothetical protein